MSWTIENLDETEEHALKEAMVAAAEADILLFCASNDQGRLTGVLYPASFDHRTFRIGAATALGTAGPETSKNVSFIAPGVDEVNVKQTVDREDLLANRRFSSSIAIARCAGLAALILQCITLTYSDRRKPDIRKHEHMSSMLMRLVDRAIDGDFKYLRAWEVFEAAKLKADTMGTNEEKNIIEAAAKEFWNTVKWGDAIPVSQPRAADAKAQQTVAPVRPSNRDGRRRIRPLAMSMMKKKAEWAHGRLRPAGHTPPVVGTLDRASTILNG